MLHEHHRTTVEVGWRRLPLPHPRRRRRHDGSEPEFGPPSAERPGNSGTVVGGRKPHAQGATTDNRRPAGEVPDEARHDAHPMSENTPVEPTFRTISRRPPLLYVSLWSFNNLRAQPPRHHGIRVVRLWPARPTGATRSGAVDAAWRPPRGSRRGRAPMARSSIWFSASWRRWPGSPGTTSRRLRVVMPTPSNAPLISAFDPGPDPDDVAVSGHEGVLREEDGEVCARSGWAVAMRPALKAAVIRVDVEGGNGAISRPGSSRMVSRQLSGRCAVVRMVATVGSSPACRYTLSP